MGCSAETQQKILDVGGDLVTTLLSEAASMLLLAAHEDSSGVDVHSKSKLLLGDPTDAEKMAQLQTDLSNIARQQFIKQFGYAYNGDRSVPSDLSTDPRAICKSHEDFVSVAEGDTATMTTYVDNTILGGGGGSFPSWFSKGFSNDLITTMTTISQAANENWQVEKFEQTYSDPSAKQMDIACNAIMLYASATLTENGQTVTKSIIYYAGLYYNSVSWGLQTTISQALAGEEPEKSYPVIQYAIATGTIIVSVALAAYILRSPSPAAGVILQGPFGIGLKMVLFRRGSSASVARPSPRPRSGVADDASNPGREKGLVAFGTDDIDTAWLEKILDKQGMQYTRTGATSDKDTTAEIALYSTYN